MGIQPGCELCRLCQALGHRLSDLHVQHRFRAEGLARGTNTRQRFPPAASRINVTECFQSQTHTTADRVGKECFLESHFGWSRAACVMHALWL